MSRDDVGIVQAVAPFGEHFWLGIVSLDCRAPARAGRALRRCQVLRSLAALSRLSFDGFDRFSFASLSMGLRRWVGGSILAVQVWRTSACISGTYALGWLGVSRCWKAPLVVSHAAAWAPGKPLVSQSIARLTDRRFRRLALCEGFSDARLTAVRGSLRLASLSLRGWTGQALSLRRGGF